MLSKIPHNFFIDESKVFKNSCQYLVVNKDITINIV